MDETDDKLAEIEEIARGLRGPRFRAHDPAFAARVALLRDYALQLANPPPIPPAPPAAHGVSLTCPRCGNAVTVTLT